jgi:CRISPR-associated protein Cas1
MRIRSLLFKEGDNKNNLYHLPDYQKKTPHQKKDFIRTYDNVFRISPNGVMKLMIELNKTFSQMVPIGHNNQGWSNLIFIMAQQLTNHLTEKRKGFDLSKPDVKLDRVDSKEIPEKIKNMSYTEWIKNGGSRGSLWYMKKKASEDGKYMIHRNNLLLSKPKLIQKEIGVN